MKPDQSSIMKEKDEITYKENRKQENRDMTEDMTHLYPEIFKILTPMVEKICEEHKQEQMTEELIDRLSHEIFINIEDTTNIMNVQNIQINTKENPKMEMTQSNMGQKQSMKPNSHSMMNTKKNQVNSYIGNPYKNCRASGKRSSRPQMPIKEEKVEEKVEVQENRVISDRNNPILRDLIKILILDSLTNRRPPHHHHHKPVPPRPGPRPPMPPRPPFPGTRPPMPPPRPMPRDVDDFYKFD